MAGSPRSHTSASFTSRNNRAAGQIGPKRSCTTTPASFSFRSLRGLRAAKEGVYSVVDELLFPNERDMLRLSVLRECLVWRGEADPLVCRSASGIPTHRQSRWPVGFLLMAARNRHCFFVRNHGDLIRISWRCRGSLATNSSKKAGVAQKVWWRCRSGRGSSLQSCESGFESHRHLHPSFAPELTERNVLPGPRCL